MLSAAWQKKQDPQNKELQTAADKFRYDGKVVANPKLIPAPEAAAPLPPCHDRPPIQSPDASPRASARPRPRGTAPPAGVPPPPRRPPARATLPGPENHRKSGLVALKIILAGFAGGDNLPLIDAGHRFSRRPKPLDSSTKSQARNPKRRKETTRFPTSIRLLPLTSDP